MSSAFKQYAEAFGDRLHVGALTDTPEQNKSLILAYGQEFVRILEGKIEGLSELPELQADLLGLLERGCPPLDIIDLMFACTAGRNSGLSDTLEVIGLSDPSLDLLRTLCHLVSAKISLLTVPQVPGPLFFLPELIPELSKEDRTRLTDDLKRLPELLATFGDLLRIYPPKNARAPELEEVIQQADIVFFYELLSHFSAGYPTLSVLLRAMRRVRITVTPKARYVRRFSRVRLRRDEPFVRDPLSTTALQRRLHRFFSTNRKWHSFLRFLVEQYVPTAFIARQINHTNTLRTSVPALIKDRMASHPVSVGRQQQR